MFSKMQNEAFHHKLGTSNMASLYRLFQPPTHCREWPSDAVNEWSMNAAKESLIPTDPQEIAASNQQKKLSSKGPNRDLDNVTISNAESNV